MFFVHRTYGAEFNESFDFVKENKPSAKQALLIIGTVAYSTFAGVRCSYSIIVDILQNNLFKSPSNLGCVEHIVYPLMHIVFLIFRPFLKL